MFQLFLNAGRQGKSNPEWFSGHLYMEPLQNWIRSNRPAHGRGQAPFPRKQSSMATRNGKTAKRCFQFRLARFQFIR